MNNNLNSNKIISDEFQPIAADEVMLIDRSLLTANKKNHPVKMARLLRSKQQVIKRRACVFSLEYPLNLPVTQKKQEIYDTIFQHQVVIIAGETGSGKTTQLPKICLELGRGIFGSIGHTQPRRIAARSVANRLAQELQVELGDIVGYQIRFKSHTSERTRIKIMTDGILLSEIKKDPLLYQYDTIIIDEAHERSLNIDFLLGYLSKILPQRPDLKIIITSATIDVQRFSIHFNHAPIIEVSGRSYPVAIHYLPFDSEVDREIDQIDKIIQAIEILAQEKIGDILIFLSGEKEIRDTSEALNKLTLPNTEILPLFSRLSAREQNRIFTPISARRIILATNVAETSLTIPSIRYVIDTGMARISRYSIKNKVQRLPIEAISRASADQRAGRCGRTSDGICIRLYSEMDYLARSEFTQPEILRTNLASVILQMGALGLGDIKVFPFIQPPEPRYIQDGVKLLQEIGAINSSEKPLQQPMLTQIGYILARFPIDPRLARMVVAAKKYGCIRDILIITAALSIVDPREIPFNKKQQAQEKHRVYYHESSDFMTWLNLWNYLQEQQKILTVNQYRKLCQREFLNYLRVREWEDVYNQLCQLAKEMQYTLNTQPADYLSIHLSLLAGMPSHIGQKQLEKQIYLGSRGIHFKLSPQSALYKKMPKWCVAATLLETNQLWASGVAQIQPEWIEQVVPSHLLKHHYSEPFWSKKQGGVLAKERVTLYGLPIIVQRIVSYGKLDPILSRELFIRHALVSGEWNKDYSFYQVNKQLLDEAETLEHKARRRDIIITDEELYQFYAANIPENIISVMHFDKWYRTQSTDKLLFKKEQIIKQDIAQKITLNSYPDVWQQNEHTFKLSYHFSPGSKCDGVTLHLPLLLLNQVNIQDFEWHIPGLRHELIVALIKSLPKRLRKNFVPVPNYAEAFLQRTEATQGSLLDLLEKTLKQMTGVTVSRNDWDWDTIPSHLRLIFSIEDEKKIIQQGQDLVELKKQLATMLQQKITCDFQVDNKIATKKQTQWNFGQIDAYYEKKRHGYQTRVYPALVDEGDGVTLQFFNSIEKQQQMMLQGLSRLCLLNLPSPVKYLQEKLPNKSKLAFYFTAYGKVNELIQDCINCAIQSLIQENGGLIWCEQDYIALLQNLRGKLNERTELIANKIEKILLMNVAVNKKLKGAIDIKYICALSDIKQQLNQLIYKGFVTATTLTKLDDLLRYIQAIEKRLEKLFLDPNKDRVSLIKLNSLTEQWQKLTQLQIDYPELEQEVIQIRWMVEELRVSYFAQQLGTAYVISDKRILQAIANAKAKVI